MNSSDDSTRYMVETFGLFHVLNHFLKQALSIKTISEEAAVDPIEPLLPILINDRGQCPKEAINPPTRFDHSCERLFAVDEQVGDESYGKERHDR